LVLRLALLGGGGSHGRSSDHWRSHSLAPSSSFPLPGPVRWVVLLCHVLPPQGTDCPQTCSNRARQSCTFPIQKWLKNAF
jgi:hypothetical protein